MTGTLVSDNIICRKFIWLHKTDEDKGHDYYCSCPAFILARVCSCSLRDGHSRHLNLLPLATRIEY
jgi:hypothetical protein